MPGVDVRSSPIQGLGVFATRDFAAGEVVMPVNDSRVVDDEHPLRLELGEYAHHQDYLAGGKVVLWPYPERHVNHSCYPNAYVQQVGDLRRVIARRPIARDEEITFDYILNTARGDVWECNCRAQRCRGTIRPSFFDLPLSLQMEYLPELNEWFVDEHKEQIEHLRDSSN